MISSILSYNCILFIYFWLCWLFMAVQVVSLVVMSKGRLLTGCVGFLCSGLPCCRAQARGAGLQQLWRMGSVVAVTGL